MNAIQYAIQLERQINNTLQLIATDADSRIIPLVEVLAKHQGKMLEILLAVENAGIAGYSQVEIPALFDESKWQEAVAAVNFNSKSLVTQLSLLWAIQAFYDKSFQYYRQAGQNTPFPAEKYFFSSLAEVKNMIRRRIDAVSHVLSNEIWGEIGFAPYIIGKE